MIGRDIIFNTGLANIKVDFIRGASNISKVGISHFSRTIDYAAHDGDGDAFEVVGFGTDTLGDALEIKESASATGAGDKFGFGDPCPRSLEDIVGKGYGLLKVGLVLNRDEVANTVTEKVACKDTAFKKEIGEVVFRGDSV